MKATLRVLSLHSSSSEADSFKRSLSSVANLPFKFESSTNPQAVLQKVQKSESDAVFIHESLREFASEDRFQELSRNHPSICFFLYTDSEDGKVHVKFSRNDGCSLDLEGQHESLALLFNVMAATEIVRRTHAEAELREVKSRFLSLAESSSVGIWHINVEGKTIYLNPAMKTMLSVENEDQLRDRLFRSFFSEDSIQRMETEHQKRIKGESSIYEVELVSGLGKRRQVIISGAPLFSPEGKLVSLICTFVDVTDSKQATSDLKYRAALKKIIAQVSAHFVNLPYDQIDQGIQESLQKTGKFLGMNRAYLFLADPDGNCFRKGFEWVREGSKPAVKTHTTLHLSDIPWYASMLERGEVFTIPAIDALGGESQGMKDWFEGQGVDSHVCVPLLCAGKLSGFMAFDGADPTGLWPEDVLHLFQILGEIFVSSLNRKESEGQLKKLSLAVEQSTSIVMITDAKGRIEYVNPKFTKVTGYSAEEVMGKNPRFLKADKIPTEEYKSLWDALITGQEWQGDFLNKKKSGELYWERASISPIKNSGGVITHYLAVKEDITNRRRAEETIQHMAYYDPLTDLPNKILFNDRLTQALAHARNKKQLVAIMLLDLDRFKNINDTLGHTVGDLLLQEVARRLGREMREGDTLARLGGDEFMILLTGIQQVEEAVQLAQEKLLVLKPAFHLEGHEVHSTPSIGISIFPYDGEDSVTLLKNADTALNRAKEQGRSTYQLYTPAMNAKAFERMTLENSLRKALEKDEFTLYYQPQLDLTSGEIIGMEALIRWEHPDMGLVSPTQFIPLAEETGLIIPIGEWVLETACRQNKEWQNAGYTPMRIAVNLSARQFREQNIVEMIAGCLKTTGLEPHWLDLEITESTIMQNIDKTIATLRSLSRLGIHISIDDFGTGYSSLSYLKKFPIQTLKIDRSFIREITIDPDDAAITSAVIAMAHRLKLKVTAEGVETMEQLKLLQTMNCDQMQGFLFSKPVPAQTVTSLLMEKLHLNFRKQDAG